MSRFSKYILDLRDFFLNQDFLFFCVLFSVPNIDGKSYKSFLSFEHLGISFFLQLLLVFGLSAVDIFVFLVTTSPFSSTSTMFRKSLSSFELKKNLIVVNLLKYEKEIIKNFLPSCSIFLTEWKHYSSLLLHHFFLYI